MQHAFGSLHFDSDSVKLSMDRVIVALVLASLAALAASMPDKSGPNRGPGAGPREPKAHNCTEQKQRARDPESLCCEDDGSFCAVQCDTMGKRCHCVDTETGHRLNHRHMMGGRDSINCAGVFQCPEFNCDKVCEHGYKTDSNDCSKCMCNPAPRHQHCKTVSKLEKEGCNCNCITVPSGPMKECPLCNDTCNEDNPASCDEDKCSDDETLQSIGPFGRAQCVRDLAQDETCTPEEEGEGEEEEEEVRGPAKRRKVGKIKKAVTPCMTGQVCREVGLNENMCKMEETDSPCVMAREEDDTIKCDPRGKFKPVQCRPIEEEEEGAPTEPDNPPEAQRSIRTGRRIPQMCRCVSPEDGTTVEGTEMRVERGGKIPKCKHVHRHCEVPGLNSNRRKFMVPHGREYFDKENCRTCKCMDGDSEAVCSETGDCNVLVASDSQSEGPSNCTLEDGRVIPHDGTLKSGCQVCGCKNGRARCTKHRHCKEDRNVEGDSCDTCRKGPPGPVCGPDGRNHLSRCTATECANLADVDLEDGPCQSQDVCERHPCREGEVCVKNGGVVCLGKRGCRPHQLRQCVNIEELNCPVENENSSSSVDSSATEDQVCGDDGRTYSSLCHLLQTSSGVSVAHPGPCDDPECQGGEVCGSDSVTYPNVCILESQAMTRVDYLGACEIDGSSAEEICSKVTQEGRCQVNSDNCKHPVQPDDGCCPVCGGAVSTVIDQEALTDISESNPDMAKADEIALQIIESGLFQDVEGKCTIEVTVTDRNDIQLTLSAVEEGDSELCNNKSEELVEIINNGDIIGTSPTTDPDTQEPPLTALPQVFDMLMVAQSSPLVLLDEEGGTDSGGVRTATECSLLLLLLMFASAAVFYF